MAKTINFNALDSGAEIYTPQGTGKFLEYKRGNFKKQNVRIELPYGKQVWYTEEVLQKASKQDLAEHTSFPRYMAEQVFAQHSFVLL